MSAPLQAPSSDNLATTLARDWAIQVDTSDGAAEPTWTFVMGLSQFSPQPEATLQDDGDINSDGFSSEIVTQQKLTIQMEGLRKGTNAAGNFTPDPGIEHLRRKGEKLGADNFVRARYWRTDGRNEAKQGTFACSWSEGTEGKDGLSTFSVTLSSRGKPEDITKPTADTSGV